MRWTEPLLHGNLVDTSETAKDCLNWQPTLGKSGSPLLPGLAARIVYRDPPPVTAPEPTRAAARRVGQVPAGGEMPARVRPPNAFVSRSATQPATKPEPKPVMPIVHLRSGDTVVCRVIKIDTEGITIESDVTDVTFIKQDRVKALELLPDVPATKIAKFKRERLLTLPRLERDNPPTPARSLC